MFEFVIYKTVNGHYNLIYCIKVYFYTAMRNIFLTVNT